MNSEEVGAAVDPDMLEGILAGLSRMGLLTRGADIGVADGDGARLSSLRGLLPKRAVTSREAEVLAERLGRRLRSQMESLGPVLGESQITDLPWIAEIEHVDALPSSGMANRLPDGRWVISLNADEPELRRRFSMAHELGHTVVDEVGERLLPGYRSASHHERLERFCDRFAGALLMPRVLVRADWADGIQCVDQLSRRYRVSRPAVQVRLRQLGLIEPVDRCGRSRMKARRR